MIKQKANMSRLVFNSQISIKYPTCLTRHRADFDLEGDPIWWCTHPATHTTHQVSNSMSQNDVMGQIIKVLEDFYDQKGGSRRKWKAMKKMSISELIEAVSTALAEMKQSYWISVIEKWNRRFLIHAFRTMTGKNKPRPTAGLQKKTRPELEAMAEELGVKVEGMKKAGIIFTIAQYYENKESELRDQQSEGWEQI